MKMVINGVSEPYKELEEKYAKFTKKDFAISCNSGTSALHLALLALGVGKGDEVIIPDFTMGACAFAVSYVGAKVVTVDCDDTLTIDVTKIEEKITKKTKAIMAVHIYGRICNMQEIGRIAKKHNLKVIEDGCEAQGVPSSKYADLSCYSFYKNKIIAAEEGGIVCTDNFSYKVKMDFLKNMAFDTGHTYFHSSVGYNYRMANSQAIMALESLKNYPRNEEKRRKIEQWYNNMLPCGRGKRKAVWVYDCENTNAKTIAEAVKESRHFFKPISTFPMYKQKAGEKASFYAQVGFYLPCNPALDRKEITRICRETLKNVII